MPVEIDFLKICGQKIINLASIKGTGLRFGGKIGLIELKGDVHSAYSNYCPKLSNYLKSNIFI